MTNASYGPFFAYTTGETVTSGAVGDLTYAAWGTKNYTFTSVTITTVDGVTTIDGTRFIENATRHAPSLNVTYDYDADGRLVEMRDGLNQTTRYTYDALGRKTRETAPDGTHQDFTYDANDLVVVFQDPNGNVARTTYDALHRSIRVRASLGSGVVGTDAQDFVYDAQGRKAMEWDNDTVTGESVYVAKTYDSLGHVLSETEGAQTAKSTYDGLGNRLTFTYPNGRVINNTYDDLERLHEVWSLGAQHVLGGPFAGAGTFSSDELLATSSYLGPSKLLQRSLGNGIVRTENYDAANRLADLTYTRASVLLVGFNYTYDHDGRKVAERKLHQASDDEAYTLDALGRLKAFERPSTAVADLTSQQWSFDKANNWASTTRTTTSGGPIDQSRGHTVTNELVSETTTGGTRTLTYDLNGNLIDDGVHAYKWDFKNRLRQVDVLTPGGPVKIAWYSYDAENRRTEKDLAVTGQSTLYFSDGMNEVQEMDCYGNVQKQYVYGSGVDELLVMDEPAATLTDASGTCAFAGHGSGLDLASLLACLNPSITSTLPPAAEGACGPCAYEATSSITGFVGGDGKASCNPCLAYGNDGQAIARCISCNGEAYSFTAVPFTLAGAVGGCNPCGPHVDASGLFVDATHWILDAQASMDCLPCPVRLLLGLHVQASGMDPTNPSITHGDPASLTDCKPANLGARRYVLQDEQMSVYGLTDNDGIVVEGYEYDPYGNVLVFTPGISGIVTYTTSDLMTGPGTASIEYTYTGRRYDAESHLLYYRSRYLDSEMGRFISRDTIGVWADASALGGAYSYVASAPHQRTDATGTCPVCWWVAAGLLSLILEETSQDAEPIEEHPAPQIYEFEVPKANLEDINAEYFIPWGETFDGSTGDARDFDPAWQPEKSRLSFLIQPRLGRGQLYVNVSCRVEGPCSSAGTGKPNDFHWSVDGGHLGLRGTFYNANYHDSYVPGIDVCLDFFLQDSGGRVEYSWEGFPSLEIAYGESLIVKEAGSDPSKLYGGC